MRKILFLLFASGLCAMATAGSRVIENPDYTMSSSIAFGITKAELTDTATRVSADIYGHPGWWVRAGSNFALKGTRTGHVYKMTRLEGMPVGEKVYLPDSAYISVTFVFPPLAPADSVVDFSEEMDDPSASWRVSGLQLGAQPDGIKTHITGRLEGRPEVSWLVLSPSFSDIRVNKSLIVPVRNGRFDYTLTADETEMYELVPGADMLNGSWRMYRFFSEGADVRVDVDDRTAQNVFGGPLTEHYNRQKNRENLPIAESRLEAIYDSLESSREFYTPEYYALMDAFTAGGDMPQARRDSLYSQEKRLVESDSMYSKAGKEWQALSARVYAESDSIRDEFIKNDTTLVGLYMIYYKKTFPNRNVPNAQSELEKLLSVFSEVYKDRFPDHSYTKALSELCVAERAEPGRKVPDFTAADIDGSEHRLSSLIKDRVALVDLWASWCGPCRRHSIAMIPVYEKWKDSGFTVVGVARESIDTDAMLKAIEHDGYPWKNLVELNDQGKIWEKYGVAGAGGLMVLVDRDGTVVALNPTAEEVEAYLESQLK
ncbi:MAG: AhpC/TSA family protein [Muribaculaceae bacterium]|nr:AhpC/TSA family protein [Muribaculaceae bacterium]